MYVYYLGVKITGGVVGNTTMGDGTRSVTARNVLNNNSVIYLDGNNEDHINKTLFRCASGEGISGLNLYFNHTLLARKSCNGFVEPRGANRSTYPGVLNAHVCRLFNTSTEGVYTCSMMNQNVSVGVYLHGRSKLFHIHT